MKKSPMRTIMGILLLLTATTLVYAAVFYPSARRQLTSLQAEIRLTESRAQLYAAYVQDASALEQEIEQLQETIDQMRSDANSDEFRVSFAISDAVKTYGVSMLSLSLGKPVSYQESRALPVHLSVRGSTENVLQFVRHFETTTEASYVLRGVTLDISAQRTDASLVLYVCVPEL